MSVIVKLLSKFDDSGIKKAKTSFGGLKKTLAGIGLGIGVSQVTDLFIDSAKAASADAKSTLLLNTQLEKNAKATKTQIKQADKFVEKLSLQTGILDDDLRPSFGKLARATKDTSKAQDLLKLSLDAATVSGKPLDSVASAMAKAFNGNTTSLIKMFPELKKSKDLFGDLKTEVEGAATQQADPFMKFNNSIDMLKEKLGAVILPMLSDFVDYLSKPGGIIDQVGTFLDTMKDPKSEAGKMMTNIKNAAKNAFNFVKGLFELFKNPYVQALAFSVLAFVGALKLFTAIATAVEFALGILNGELIIMDGALTAMGWGLIVAAIAAVVAGIVYLATKTQFFQTVWDILVKAFHAGIDWMAGAWTAVQDAFKVAFDFIGNVFKGYVNFWISMFEGFINGVLHGVNMMVGGLNSMLDGVKAVTFGGVNLHVNPIPDVKLPKLAKGGIVMPRVGGTNVTVGEGGKAEAIIPLNGKTGFGNTVNIYVQSADPKAVVDAVAKYVKVNGKLPSAWGR